MNEELPVVMPPDTQARLDALLKDLETTKAQLAEIQKQVVTMESVYQAVIVRLFMVASSEGAGK